MAQLERTKERSKPTTLRYALSKVIFLFIYALRYAARKPTASGKGSFLPLPSTYEAARAQRRAHAASILRFAQGQAVLGYSLSPFHGWCVLWIDHCGSDFHFWVMFYQEQSH